MNAVTLNNNVRMPQVGLGVWRMTDDETEKAVATALDAGYRSIDTATWPRSTASTRAAVSAPTPPLPADRPTGRIGQIFP